MFGWETEPKDERPSEFVPSTGYSALSGYYAMPDAANPRRPQRGGVLTLLIAGALVVGLGTAGLFALMHIVRG